MKYQQQHWLPDNSGSVQETGLQGNSITNGYMYFLQGFLSAPIMNLSTFIKIL